MHSVSVISVLGLIASCATAYNGPKGTGNFTLQVIATGGSLIDTGDFLGPYHVGAALNALVPELSQKGAQTYSFHSSTGVIGGRLGDYVYNLTLSGATDYPPPSGYHVMGLDAGRGDAFSFGTQGGNYLLPPSSHPKATWAICPAVIYTPGVYVDTLVWRTADGVKNSTCADVKIKAVF